MLDVYETCESSTHTSFRLFKKTKKEKSSFPKLPTVLLQYLYLPRSLQKTLNDLKDYQKKHDFWQHQNEKLLAEQVPANIKINQHVAHESLKMQQANTEIGWFVCLCQIYHTIGCLFGVFLVFFSHIYSSLLCTQ